MDAPLPIHECTIRRCPNPRAIMISIASLRALAWVRKCDCYTGSPLRESLTLPCVVAFVVHECYDFEQVFTFIESPDFVHTLPPHPAHERSGWTHLSNGMIRM